MNHEDWAESQEETSVTVDGHELSVAYRDEGEGDSPPIVFLHGIPTWSFLWRDIVPEIAESRRVITPDLVGYGNSAMEDEFDRSIRAQEAMFADLLSQLGIRRVSVVSHDIGGGVALRYASHHPDAVEKLVCSNAVCYDSWPVEFISDLGLPSTTKTDLDELEEQVSAAFSQGTYHEPDSEFVEGLTAPWISEEGRTSLARCAVSTNTNHTTEIDYGAITADLLCLWGSEDSFQSIEYGQRLAEELDGDVIGLDDAYHWVMEDRPRQYIEELQKFLGNDE